MLAAAASRSCWKTRGSALPHDSPRAPRRGLLVVGIGVTVAVLRRRRAGGGSPGDGMCISAAACRVCWPLYRGLKGPWLRKSSGVYKHDDTRPRLGRKIAGESRRELKDLGLLVDPDLKRRGLGGREIVAVGRSWSVGAEQL